MSTFAAFGCFATLVLASFAGDRRERLVAHTGLAVTGSVLVVIGTAVSYSTVLAALVTLVVAFAVLFAGVTSANAASGATAALLGYVLPAASPGTIGMIPWRLAGWWLASVVGTAAVLIVYSPPPDSNLRRAAAQCARSLAAELDTALAGTLTQAHSTAAKEAKLALMKASIEAPYRPTGITRIDQAVAGLVDSLQWCTTAVAEAVADRSRCAVVSGADRARLARSRDVLALTAAQVDGGPTANLEGAVRSLGAQGAIDWPSPESQADDGGGREAMRRDFHSRVVASAAAMVGTNALAATGHAPPNGDTEGRASRSGQLGPSGSRGTGPPWPQSLWILLAGHASLRSIWFLNSARGAAALAAAVGIAGVTNVQHGFWVVLGALSVLRASAASTGATALRALAGTAVGFFVGAALVVGIGGDTSALWAMLPVAVLVAAYAPGTLPFAAGQAAFTLLISVLYNIIVPVGWKVGEVRLEDVALGAAVSVAAGLLFWPRGATTVVANDLADAFHIGGLYLVEACAWALGIGRQSPDGQAVASANSRLQAALHGLLAEQGTHRIPRDTVWRLAGGTNRLRLMAQTLARSPSSESTHFGEGARLAMDEAVEVAGLYDHLATQLGNLPPTVAEEISTLDLGESPEAPTEPRATYVRECLDRLRTEAAAMNGPTSTLAARLSRPWWI